MTINPKALTDLLKYLRGEPWPVSYGASPDVVLDRLLAALPAGDEAEVVKELLNLATRSSSEYHVSLFRNSASLIERQSATIAQLRGEVAKWEERHARLLTKAGRMVERADADNGRAAKAEARLALVEPAAQYLWKLLDDIDTASDIAKADDDLYRKLAERLQRKRFDVGSTDGYTVQFHALPQTDGAPQVAEETR